METGRKEITDLAYKIAHEDWGMTKNAGSNLTEALMKLHRKGLSLAEIEDVAGDIIEIAYRHSSNDEPGA